MIKQACVKKHVKIKIELILKAASGWTQAVKQVVSTNAGDRSPPVITHSILI